MALTEEFQKRADIIRRQAERGKETAQRRLKRQFQGRLGSGAFAKVVQEAETEIGRVEQQALTGLAGEQSGQEREERLLIGEREFRSSEQAKILEEQEKGRLESARQFDLEFEQNTRTLALNQALALIEEGLLTGGKIEAAKDILARFFAGLGDPGEVSGLFGEGQGPVEGTPAGSSSLSGTELRAFATQGGFNQALLAIQSGPGGPAPTGFDLKNVPNANLARIKGMLDSVGGRVVRFNQSQLDEMRRLFGF